MEVGVGRQASIFEFECTALSFDEGVSMHSTLDIDVTTAINEIVDLVGAQTPSSGFAASRLQLRGSLISHPAARRNIATRTVSTYIRYASTSYVSRLTVRFELCAGWVLMDVNGTIKKII